MNGERSASTTALDTTGKHEPDGLAKATTESHEEFETALRASVRHARTCGKHLIEADELLPRGEFEPWVKQHFTFSLRMAQVHMRPRQVEAHQTPLDRGEVPSLGQMNRLLATPRPESPSPATATGSPRWWPPGPG